MTETSVGLGRDTVGEFAFPGKSCLVGNVAASWPCILSPPGPEALCAIHGILRPWTPGPSFLLVFWVGLQKLSSQDVRGRSQH